MVDLIRVVLPESTPRPCLLGVLFLLLLLVGLGVVLFLGVVSVGLVVNFEHLVTGVVGFINIGGRRLKGPAL